MPTNESAPCWKSQNCPPVRGDRAETVPIKWLRAENVGLVGRTNQMAPCWKCSREDESDGSVLKSNNCSCWKCRQNSTCWKCRQKIAHNGILGHDPYSLHPVYPRNVFLKHHRTRLLSICLRTAYVLPLQHPTEFQLQQRIIPVTSFYCITSGLPTPLSTLQGCR